ncbi:MAG: hypothetical protein QOJ72_2703, partial [Nocardioidaceae bacterium]|nr:hypothetical protein [Nocardioidaceae bacterium]
EDTLADARIQLATYLLGPPERRTLESFRASIDAVIARSESERAAYRDGTRPSETVVASDDDD